jgi:hypothetical protein
MEPGQARRRGPCGLATAAGAVHPELALPRRVGAGGRRGGGIPCTVALAHLQEPEPMSHRLLPLAGCVLLLAAAPMYADDAEDQAVKAVQKFGGRVVRDDNDPGKHVVEVFLGETGVTDAGLQDGLAVQNSCGGRSVRTSSIPRRAARRLGGAGRGPRRSGGGGEEDGRRAETVTMRCRRERVGMKGPGQVAGSAFDRLASISVARVDADDDVGPDAAVFKALP